MSSMTHQAPFPRAPLIAVGVLLTAAILLAAGGSLTGLGKTRMPEGSVVESRELVFVDQADGGVGVYDGATREKITVMAPGTNGFLRATLRGLARARHLSGIGSDAPFRLMTWTDGHIFLEDPATGRLVALDAFGPTNAHVFAELLHEGSQTR